MQAYLSFDKIFEENKVQLGGGANWGLGVGDCSLGGQLPSAPYQIMPLGKSQCYFKLLTAVRKIFHFKLGLPYRQGILMSRNILNANN